MGRTPRIGFVGAGFMGQTAHLRNYVRTDGCDVVALAEPREHLAEAVARRFGIDDVYRDHEELLENADVDGIVAAQPYARHEFIVPEILEAGLPLFTEKPLALRPETGERLADLADEHGVTHMVGYHKRSDPAMERARDVIDEWKASGEVGDLRHVRITMPPGDWIAGAPEPVSGEEDPPSGETESPPADFDEEAGRAFDAFVNYYIHQVNAFRFLFGEGYSVRYAGDSVLVVESDSGASGVLEMAPCTTAERWEESVLVGFENGRISVDLPPPLISQSAGNVEIQRTVDGTDELVRPSMPDTAAMRRQAENFVAVVRGDRAPPCDSREAVADLHVAREYVERTH